MKMKYLASTVCCLLPYLFASFADLRLQVCVLSDELSYIVYLRTVCFHYHDCVLICTLFK